MPYISYDALPFLAAACLVPIVIFLLNIAIRYKRELPQTACADFLLLILVFDAAIIIDPSQTLDIFPQRIPIKSVSAAYTILALAAILNWVWSVFFVEPEMHTYHNFSKKNLSSENLPPQKEGYCSTWIRWFLVWSLSVAIVAVHIVSMGK